MLDTLRRIVQQVSSAEDLDTALAVIVRSVKAAIHADVCSVYLTNFDTREHVLMATDGLHAESPGKVRLPLFRGLVGLVSERAEPINLADGPSHARYMFVAETGERKFHGFLGAPIIRNRKVLGVLVVRQEEPREFEEDEVNFILTLAAQLAGAISHAQASGELVMGAGQQALSGHFLQGQAGAAGVGIGRAVVAYPLADLDAVPERPAQDVAFEVDSLHHAVNAVEEDLRRLKDRLGDSLPEEDRVLFDALMLMLRSETLVERAEQLIR
ncbi:MAG: GAF domain-containing protein, partial [Pseudomonadota bacterium]